MNYYDILLAKKLEDNRDPQVVGLSVTENGTYSEEGKVYKPVVVNVPLPSNAYLLQTIEHESIATFTDGTDNFLKSLEVAIEPQQEGSGDPSPENIRPISGWSAVDVTKCGKNILPKSMNTNNGFISQYALLPDGSGNVDLGLDVSEFFKVPPSGKITLSGLTGNGRSYCFYDKDKNYISGDSYQNRTTITVTVPANAVFIRLTLVHRDSATQNTDEMVEIGETASTYEPYNGQTYTIDLDGTRYGGKLDVVSGVLTLTDGFISSYNGETLPSTWISDRDVYAEGTTPTIGAEVVYELATPQTIQLTPTIIKSLQGENNFFADSGEIELLQYFGKETA
jgi:hypothetical protein